MPSDFRRSMPSGRGPPGEILTLENIEAIVEVAVRAACMHESAVSLTDLARLMPEDTNTTDLVTAFESLPALRENYLLREGYVLSRSEAHKDLFSESERRRHSMLTLRSQGVSHQDWEEETRSYFRVAARRH